MAHTRRTGDAPATPAEGPGPDTPPVRVFTGAFDASAGGSVFGGARRVIATRTALIPGQSPSQRVGAACVRGAAEFAAAGTLKLPACGLSRFHTTVAPFSIQGLL